MVELDQTKVKNFSSNETHDKFNRGKFKTKKQRKHMR